MERRAPIGREGGKVIGFPTARGETPTLLHRKERGERGREEGRGRQSKDTEESGLPLRWPPIHETKSLHFPRFKFWMKNVLITFLRDGVLFQISGDNSTLC